VKNSSVPLTDVPAEWGGTPMETLVRAHNLGETLDPPHSPQMVIATCMDFRIQMRIPAGFAFVIRTAGANIAGAELDIAVAVAARNIRSIAVVTHTDCAMADVTAKRDVLVEGLASVGWSHDDATGLVDRHAGAREIGDEAAFAVRQAEQLRAQYPTLQVEPLLYHIEDGRLSRVM